MSFKKTLFKNLIVSGSYNYLSMGIAFVASMITSRLLLPENYGFVGLITVFTGFIAVFSDGGISYAIIRGDHGYTYQRVLANLAFYLGIILFLLTLILAIPISRYYGNPKLIAPTIVLGFYFIIQSLGLVNGAILNKSLNFAYIGKVTLIKTIIVAISTIILAWLKFEHWALVYSQITGGIFSVIMFERKVKLGFKFFKVQYLIVIFQETKKLIGNVLGFNIVNYWSRNADNMIVAKFYGSADLGIYNRAYSLLLLPMNLITGIFNIVLFPSLKKLKSEGGNIEQEFYFVLKVISIITTPIVIVLVLFPLKLVVFLWGSNWIKVAEILPFFGLLVYSQTLVSTGGQLLILQGKEKELRIFGWGCAFFIVSSIISGAFYSIFYIACFYSFAFIVFILGFNLYYVHIKCLEFGVKQVFIFWIPKITLSLLIWIGITFKESIFLLISVCILVIYQLIESKRGGGIILSKLRAQIKSLNK